MENWKELLKEFVLKHLDKQDVSSPEELARNFINSMKRNNKWIKVPLNSIQKKIEAIIAEEKNIKSGSNTGKNRSEKQDNRKQMEDEIEAIKQFIEKKLEENKTNELAEETVKEVDTKNKEVQRDQAIWKIYSKRGGIHDILDDIHTAVLHPSINARDFDDEEGQYVFFITIHNTYIVSFKTMWERLEKGLAEDSTDYNKDGSNLLERQKGLIVQQEGLEKSLTSYKKQYEKPNKGEWEIKQILGLFQTLYKRTKTYIEEVEEYENQLKNFEERRTELCKYEPKYEELYQLLKDLYESLDGSNGAFSSLTVSPGPEDGLDGYIQTAKEFCDKITKIIENEQYKL